MSLDRQPLAALYDLAHQCGHWDPEKHIVYLELLLENVKVAGERGGGLLPYLSSFS